MHGVRNIDLSATPPGDVRSERTHRSRLGWPSGGAPAGSTGRLMGRMNYIQYSPHTFDPTDSPVIVLARTSSNEEEDPAPMNDWISKSRRHEIY